MLSLLCAPDELYHSFCFTPVLNRGVHLATMVWILTNYMLQKCYRGRKAVEAERAKVREQFCFSFGDHCQKVDRYVFHSSLRLC